MCGARLRRARGGAEGEERTTAALPHISGGLGGVNLGEALVRLEPIVGLDQLGDGAPRQLRHHVAKTLSVTVQALLKDAPLLRAPVAPASRHAQGWRYRVGALREAQLLNLPPEPLLLHHIAEQRAIRTPDHGARAGHAAGRRRQREDEEALRLRTPSAHVLRIRMGARPTAGRIFRSRSRREQLRAAARGVQQRRWPRPLAVSGEQGRVQRGHSGLELVAHPHPWRVLLARLAPLPLLLLVGRLRLLCAVGLRPLGFGASRGRALQQRAPLTHW